MSLPHLSDKELEDILAARLDPLFESFFDHSFPLDAGQLPTPFESSDSSTTTTDALLFDSFSTGGSSTTSTGFGVTDLSPASGFDLVLRPAAHKAAAAAALPPANGAPRTRKLVHQLRPDGPGISGPELLSLEGQSQPMEIGPIRLGGRAGGDDKAPPSTHCPHPSTPPITPNPQRVVRPRTSTSPIRKNRVASKRSRSHSAKTAAAAAAAAVSTATASSVSDVPDVPAIPYATLRLKAPTMLQTAGRATPLDIPHRPAKLPPSPPSSARLPSHEHGAMAFMGSNHGAAMPPYASQGFGSGSGFGPVNYAAHDANGFVSTSHDDMAMLASPWPRQGHAEASYSIYSPWDATATPVFDNSTSIYDMPMYSAVEPQHPYLFDPSLANNGLMIQYDNSRDPYTHQSATSSSFSYPNQEMAHDSSVPPRASMSPSMPMHPSERTRDIDPAPITLPKRGNGNGNGTGSVKGPMRRNTAKHTREASRTGNSAHPSATASSPIMDASAEHRPATVRGKPRPRPHMQHAPSQSTGNIRASLAGGSLRAHKSTGSLASASASCASKGATGSRGTGTARASAAKASSGAGGDKGGNEPKAAAGAIGFVNFTPSDSRKILTGVAPSGSSKTKARREREALERRRRLSEAAAKAVREAGGDVAGLWREGGLDGEDGWRWDENFGSGVGGSGGSGGDAMDGMD